MKPLQSLTWRWRTFSAWAPSWRGRGRGGCSRPPWGRGGRWYSSGWVVRREMRHSILIISPLIFIWYCRWASLNWQLPCTRTRGWRTHWTEHSGCWSLQSRWIPCSSPSRSTRSAMSIVVTRVLQFWHLYFNEYSEKWLSIQEYFQDTIINRDWKKLSPPSACFYDAQWHSCGKLLVACWLINGKWWPAE